jgi:hypothetical protein
MASSNQAARAPEPRPVEDHTNARPLPKPETKPTKFVIKVVAGIPA